MRVVETFPPLLCRLIVTLACAAGTLQGQGARTPLQITISDLAANPGKFDGQFVRVRALLVYGWEGDDFLSDPTPQSTRPPHLWVYWEPEHDKDIAGAFRADRESVEAWFMGYFRFVPNHRPNGMFDPGSLQLEAIEVSDSQLSQSLSATIGRGDLEAARKIIRSGAKLNVWDEYDSFPLWNASALGYTDLVEDLLAAGADPNFTAPGESTALQTAASHCNVAVAKGLLEHGASANAADVGGETPLILSSQACSDGEMVQLLLDAKANPNAKTDNGVTALMAATRNPLVAEKLLKAGADPAAQSDSGTTAESLSCDRGAEGFYRVCQLMRKALSKPTCEAGSCN